VITFGNPNALKKRCFEYLSSLGISRATFDNAFKNALDKQHEIRRELRDRQKQLLDDAIRDRKLVFVVAGRPYHTDPLVHQKVGQVLSDLGILTLTDDVFCVKESDGFSDLKIVSQWSYPNRVVQAAMEVAKLPQNVQLIQLNSFGCGPDSFFMDETGNILKNAAKNHTILRIDEIASTGSIRLRLRSLIESLRITGLVSNQTAPEPYKGYTATYTEADRGKTILVPWFADFLSPFIPAIGKLGGYKVENLPKSNKQSAETGLKYGHNEVCYPSILVLGDIIETLKSGKYNLNELVVAITQTGGQCRATNYVSQIKTGLENAGFADIPVLVLSTEGALQNEQKAFKLPVAKMLNIVVYTMLYADGLQQMYSSTLIREKNRGETQQLFDFYITEGVNAVLDNNHKTLLALLGQAVADFNQIPVHEREYTKVGLVGEIYIKYNNYGQAYISEWLHSRGMEVVTPPIIDFFMQYFVNSGINDDNGMENKGFTSKLLTPILWNSMNKRISRIEAILKEFRFYYPAESIYEKAQYASEILDLSNQFGEGWAIAAEVSGYSRRGIHKVVCIQPFGCIANHIVAKGIEKRLKKIYPDISLLYLDIDGGMAEVNLQNRLHFLING
jgi:predicted nucleotide-binding protein (sugar kinase/HSP70/actin superfamily)